MSMAGEIENSEYAIKKLNELLNNSDISAEDFAALTSRLSYEIVRLNKLQEKD